MKTWRLLVDKKREEAAHTPSKKDENLKHTVSAACRPRVFQIALFKGFVNIPHTTPPTGHTVGTNKATKRGFLVVGKFKSASFLIIQQSVVEPKKVLKFMGGCAKVTKCNNTLYPSPRGRV